jgi:Na+/melibiose symporter-like transporter
MDVPSTSLPAQGYAEAAGHAAASAPRLSLLTKVLYGVGEISNSIKTFTFGLFLLFYYTSVLGLPGTLVGAATSISLIWDAVLDPYIGHISDRFRSRYGRRHPFMLVGAILMGVSFYLIFAPPAGLAGAWLFAWLLGSNILLRTTNSLFMVPYHALGAELSADYYERTSVTGVRAAFALGGTLVAAGLSFAVFFPETTPGVDPKFNSAGYGRMALAFGATIMATGLIATFATFATFRHRSSAAVPEQAAAGAQTGQMGFWQNLLIALRNRTFLVLTLSSALFFLGSVVNATLGIHYLTYYARITNSNALSLFQLSFYVGALIGVAFWLRNLRRFAKHHLFITNTLLLAVLMGMAYFLVGGGKLLGAGNVRPLIVVNAIGGFFAAALWIVPASMVADVADVDELRTRRRREGAFFGIHSFFMQEGASLAVLTAGLLIDIFARLVPGQVEQSALTVERIGMLFGLLPAAIYCVAAALMTRYRLTPARLQEVQRELQRQRAATGRVE